MPGLENYKPVKERIHEFRQQHPDWRIRNELHRVDDQHWMAESTIYDAEGNRIANGHAYEKAVRPFDAEKAETSAVGRALVFAGWTDSLELSQEELERSEGVTEQRNQPSPTRSPQPVDRGPVTPQTIQKQPPLSVVNDPNPPPFLDMLRLNRPASTAPKGIWYDHLTALVAAAAHDGIKVDWKGMAGGKNADKLTTGELKILIADLELEMLGGGV